MGLSNVERYRALNSKKEKSNSSLSSNVQRYKEYSLQKDLENANRAISESYGGWQNPETMASNKTALENAQKNLLSYYDLNQSNLTQRQKNAYNSVLNNYDSALKSWDETAKYYSNYINEEGYNKAKKTYELGQKYKGASYEDIQNALKSAADLDEISFLKNYTDYSSLEDFDKAIADRESKRAETQKGRKGKVVDVSEEKLKNAKEIYEKTHAFDDYKYLMDQEDYAELSKDSDALRRYESGVATDPIRMMARGNVAYSDSLSDEQKDMATYIYNTQGEKAYLDYMKKMTFVARQKEAAEMQKESSEFAKEHPVAASFIYPTFDTLMGGLAGIESLVSIANGETAPTVMQNLVSANSQSIGQISQDIKDNGFLGKVEGFGYDVFTTAIPNRLGQMLFGSGYNIVMGLQSFADTYASEVNNGTPSGTALLNALVTGGIETLTEQVGMEWAFGESKGAIETVLKQAFAEGSEEIVGSLANLIYDINVNGGEAEYYQNIQNYIAMGYSSAEAKEKATLDYIKDVAHQFAVAAFSTLPTGGVQQANRVYNESKMGEYIDREKLAEVGSEELLKKYGEEWSQKASNREIYNAYDKYVTDTKTKATEAEKADSVKALMSEYNLSEEEATKYVEALYEGKNKRILNTHFGSVIKEEADNGTGWAAKGDFSESSKYVDNLTKAADMVMSKDQVLANKAQKKLKVAEKNTVNGEDADIISMKANKDGSYTVKTSKGEVDSKEVTVTDNKAKALSYSADIQNETLKEAFVHYYQGEDISDYDQYVRTAYEAGIESLDLSEFTSVIDGLGKAKAMAFYNLGAEKTLREELATEETLDKVTKAIKSTGKFESGVFTDGKFKKDDTIFRNLNRTQKKLYKVVEAFSKLSGINTRIFVDRSAASKNGEFVSGTDGGWISINLAARPYGDSMYGINRYVVSTLSHELTHWLKANNEEAYNILENAIVESLTEKGTLEDAIKKEQDSYKKTEGEELSREVALEEVVARACENMLNNTDTMAEVLSHTDMNGLERLKVAFEEWFEHIKEFFDELMSGFSSPNEITQSLSEEYEDLRKIWVKGINDAINMKRSGQQSSEKKVASVKASIKMTTDNKQAVVVSDDILANVAQDKWVETVKNALFSHEIKVPHDVIKVNNVTRGEYTYSDYTKYLKRKEGTKYYDKLRVAKYIDEVVEASVGYVNEESKHKNFDTFSRGNVLLDIGGNQYSAEVVIGITKKKEMVFYDIVNIVPQKFQYKRTITSDESQRDVSQKGYRSLENNIPQNDANVKNSVKLSEREEKALDTLNVEVEGSYAYPKFNLKTFRESDYNKNIDVAAAALAKQMEISAEEAKKYIKDVGSIANIIARDRDRLDYAAIEGKSAWVSNPEYGGSLDYSFLCPKRLTYTGTMNAILRKQNDLIFSVDDFLWLRKALITAGYEAPCSYCFVESARARFGKYNKQFLDIAKAENLSYIPTAEDLTNPDKLEEMREKHPETYNRYEKFLNSLSQRNPKMLEERRAYNGDILKAFQGKEDTIKDKNLHGGIRFNSFSDFEIVHMLDCMQAIMDMSRVGLAGFGYTKQKAFVEIFGKTGLKINMSCMAKGVEADGKHIIFDDIEGMNHNDALKLRSGNVGIVCVVFNDVQLKAALCDERIDYVLPFHRSQWSKADYEKMGLSLDTKDYTKPQAEKLGTKKAKEGNIPFLSYWSENQTGTETVQRYLDLINEQGKTPIFPVVLEKVDGKWVMPKGIKKNGKFINKTEEIKEKAAENYWKLLTEAKMYNNDGTPIRQTAVTPNFNMKAARELLKKYDGSHKEFPVAQNVVDDFLEYKKTGETKNFEWKRNSNKQTISSENTSLNQTPATFTNYEFKSTDRILDWGGGRYDTSKKALEATYPGIKVEVVDPFNRTESHNNRVLKEYSNNKANVLTVNNVLNVINSSSAIEDVIKESKNYLSKDGIAYFAIYEGDGSGVGKETSAGYQNNQKASYYVPFVEKYYKNVDKKGSFIIASDGSTKTTKISTDTKARLAQNTAEFKKQNLLMKDSKYSNKMDSNGKTLTEDQDRYFKDSKIRDEKGNLLVMYHGTTKGGFTIFDPTKADDKISLFFSDTPSVSKSYSNSLREINPFRIMPTEKITDAETAKKFLEEYGIAKDIDFFETEAYGRTNRYWNGTDLINGGRYRGLTNKEFIEWAEYERKAKSGLYKVYLDIENPYIIDCKGHNWNDIFMPENTKNPDLMSKVNSYLRFVQHNIDHNYTIDDLAESLGDFEESTKYAIEEFEIEDDAEEMLKLAKEIDEIYSNWNEDDYLDEDGEPMNMRIYLLFSDEKPRTTRYIAQWAYLRGYDGVFFKNIVDTGKFGTRGNHYTSNIAVAFNSEQVKSVYNEHPTKDKDIRYSNKMDSKGSSLTEAQAKYFKDSKVRDEEGNLLVMYHGTMEEFNVFKANRFVTEQSGVTKIKGYFSEDEDYASIYGDVESYYLNIKNPLVLDGTAKTVEGWLKFFKDNGIEGVKLDSAVTGEKDHRDYLKGGYFEGKGLLFTFYEILDSGSGVWYGDGNLTEMIQKAGYDGIKSNDDYEKAWMPFDENAIKRTDNLNPTKNKDIRKSEKMSYDELSDSAKERIRELEEQVGKLSDENAALRAEKLMEKNKAEKKIMVDRITEQAKILSRWLLTDDKHNPVPQSVRIPLGKFLTSIDYTKDSYEWRKSHGLLTKSDETLGTRMAKISQMLLELDQDKAVDKDAYDMSKLDWIPEFSTEFAKIKDTIAEVESKEGERFHLGKMNHDDLQTLLNLITALKTSIVNMNKCLSAHNKMSVDAIGKNVIGYLDRIGQRDKDNAISQFLEVSNTTPYYFFQRLGEGGEQTFRLLMDGMNKYAFEAKQIKDFAEETFKGKDVNAWRNEVKTFEVEEYEIKTDKKEGEMPLERKLRTIQMTVPQIMSLYCLQKRDQAMNHIKTGGIKVGSFETREDGKKVKVRQIDNVTLTEKDLNNILSVLTDEQKEVADKLQNFMNTVCQKWGNEVTMKRFGYKGMTEKNYFPISVDRNQLSSEARQKGTSLYQLLNMGFTKPINPNAKNPIEVFDIFETFTIHATEMAQYNSLALPVLDVIKIWNYRDQELLDEEENKARWHSVKGSIESVLGEKANGYIGRLLADLNGDVTGGRADKFGKKLIKNYKTAAVAANLQVATLQPLSYIRAGYMMDTKYLTKGFAMKSNNEDALKYCGIAVWKDMGFYNTAINTGLEHMIMQDDSKKDKAIEKTLWLAGKMDSWTWGKLWNACLLETQDKYPTLEGENLYKRTGERLTEVIYGTQVVDSILTRSDLMRDQGVYASMVTAFQAEPTLSLNMLMDAAVRFEQEKRASGTQAALKVHGDKIKRAALVYLTSSAVESILRAIIGKIRSYDGDEDDETLIEDFFKRFIEELNPLRKIPLVKDIVDILVSAISKGKIYTDTRLDEAVFENIGKSYLRIQRILSGGEVNYKAINEIAKGIDASGLPVSSSIRVFKVIWNNTIGRIWDSANIK